MRSLFISPALALFITACQVPPPEPAALSEQDITAIEESTDAFAQASLEKNWNAVAQLYTEDAMFMPPNRAAVEGRTAIEEWLEDSPPMTDFKLNTEEIDGRGDLAFVRGTYSMAFVPEGASEPVQDNGKYIEIRRKQPDGSWLIARDIFNSDLPIPEGVSEEQ